MASVVDDLYRSRLGDETNIELFNTSKPTEEGRSLRQAIAARFGMWRRWWKALGGEPAPIAHIHTCSGLSYFLDGALVLIARARSVPVVLHIHGGRFDTFLDGLDPVRRFGARLFAQSASRVIVLSEGWRERLQLRLPAARICVIENAVPVANTFAPEAKDGPPVLLFLGGLSRAKGLEDLIRAVARLSHPAEAVLVGPEAEKGFADRVRALATELNVLDRVRLPGPAHADAKEGWLSRASVFVLPSHAEGLPVSLLEAMAAGLPAVATAVGAVPAVIEPGRSGLLVEPRDPEGLAAALDTLLGDQRLRAEMGRRAHAIWAERFSMDRAVKQLQAVYAEVLSSAEAG